MTREELEEIEDFVYILKSRLWCAQDTRDGIYESLKGLEDTSLKDLSREIDTLQDLDGDLGNSLENLEKAIEELEKALSKVDVTE